MLPCCGGVPIERYEWTSAICEALFELNGSYGSRVLPEEAPFMQQGLASKAASSAFGKAW